MSFSACLVRLTSLTNTPTAWWRHVFILWTFRGECYLNNQYLAYRCLHVILNTWDTVVAIDHLQTIFCELTPIVLKFLLTSGSRLPPLAAGIGMVPAL